MTTPALCWRCWGNNKVDNDDHHNGNATADGEDLASDRVGGPAPQEPPTVDLRPPSVAVTHDSGVKSTNGGAEAQSGGYLSPRMDARPNELRPCFLEFFPTVTSSAHPLGNGGGSVKRDMGANCSPSDEWRMPRVLCTKVHM